MNKDYRNIDVEHLTISQEQLINAKFYPNRWEWIKTLPEQLNIIEVGVAAGDFSEHILKTINPKSLYLIDLYILADPQLARPGRLQRYKQSENYDFVENRFKNFKQVTIMQANSQIQLPLLGNYTPGFFDMIYLDASHHFEDVCNDLDASVKLLKPSGILAFNDYVYSDEEGEKYGVVQAVNKFLHLNKDWEVIGFALDERMYCDIYIRRIQF